MPDQLITGKPAGIKGFDEQFEQLRIRNQQLEEQTAQAVGFHEANELIESSFGSAALASHSSKTGRSLPNI